MHVIVGDNIYISFSEEELSTMIHCLDDSGESALEADLLLRLRGIQHSVSGGDSEEYDLDEIPF